MANFFQYCNAYTTSTPKGGRGVIWKLKMVLAKRTETDVRQKLPVLCRHCAGLRLILAQDKNLLNHKS